MAALPPVKPPSSLVKIARWSLLSFGVMYGFEREYMLKQLEDKRRAKEEAERPAKEAAMRTERDKRNAEEMVYLAEQAGVGGAKPGSGRSGAGKCPPKAKAKETTKTGGSSTGTRTLPPGKQCNCSTCVGKRQKQQQQPKK